ncbi:MAG: IS21-like element helper ATPase IstB [Desulfuromusa sp.]|nr:IS21-like element helper ATPase IstB [Desulfuromusa sp.]
MINVGHELDQGLKSLHLPTMREYYRSEADLARQESLTYEQYLFELINHECEIRKQKRIARLLQESKLPLEKNLDVFDRKRLPAKINSLVEHLLEGSFLDRRENVLAFGNPGSGKTHILCAIALELVQQGRRILFIPCTVLVQNLLVAKRDLALVKALKKLAKYDALIIDDIGYVQQSREEMEVLFTLLANSYEQRSIMLTSNLPFSKWEQIFKDPMTTAAAIDRIVHHSIILELNLPSYRLEQSKNSRGRITK